jgi:hypothetical protein
MAIGDDAIAAGFAIVPDTGDDGEVKLGAQEINRTRDYVAQVLASIVIPWPVSQGGTGATAANIARQHLGIFSGTANPSDSVAAAVDGTIYFKIVT